MDLIKSTIVFDVPAFIRFKQQYSAMHTVGHKTESEWFDMYNEHKRRGTTPL